MRTSYPHTCTRCGNEQVALSWRPPRPDWPGLAWCHGCSPFGDVAGMTTGPGGEQGAAANGQCLGVRDAIGTAHGYLSEAQHG